MTLVRAPIFKTTHFRKVQTSTHQFGRRFLWRFLAVVVIVIVAVIQFERIVFFMMLGLCFASKLLKLTINKRLNTELKMLMHA